MNEEERFRTAMNIFGRHLVAISGSFVRPENDEQWLEFQSNGVPPDAQRQVFAFTGVPAVFRGRTYVLTAGHCIEQYRDEIRKRRAVSTGTQINDCFGPGSPNKQVLPIDLHDTQIIAVDDPYAGIDYALIPLSRNEAELLKANGLISHPIDAAFNRFDFDEKCILVGFPAERTELLFCDPGASSSIRLSPTVLPLTAAGEDDKPYPRFRGVLKAMESLTNIEGVSGGPIFARSLEDTRYGIVAIQSRWLKKRKEIIGTTAWAIADHATSRLDGAD